MVTLYVIALVPDAELVATSVDPPKSVNNISGITMDIATGTTTTIGPSLAETIETTHATDHIVTKEDPPIDANAPTPTTANATAQKLLAPDRDHDPIQAEEEAAPQAPTDTHLPTQLLDAVVLTGDDKKRKVTIKKVY